MTEGAVDIPKHFLKIEELSPEEKKASEILEIVRNKLIEKESIDKKEISRLKKEKEGIVKLLKRERNYKYVVTTLANTEIDRSKKSRKVALEILTPNLDTLKQNLWEKRYKSDPEAPLLLNLKTVQGFWFLMKRGSGVTKENIALLLDDNPKILKEKTNPAVSPLLTLYLAHRLNAPPRWGNDLPAKKILTEMATTRETSFYEKVKAFVDLAEVDEDALALIAQDFLKKNHFNEKQIKDILRSWETILVNQAEPEDRSGLVGRKAVTYLRNIENISSLEKKHPGSARTLYKEFGITHFGRYFKEHLVRQYEKRNEDLPYGVILACYEDYNAALYTDWKLNGKLYVDLFNQGFEIRIVEARDKISIVRRFVDLNERYGKNNKIAFRIINAHGKINSITFSHKENGVVRKKDLDRTKSGKNMADFFAPGMVTIFNSCSTGKENAIGVMHALRGEKVIAPNEDSSIETIIPVKKRERPIDFEVVYNNEANAMSYEG